MMQKTEFVLLVLLATITHMRAGSINFNLKNEPVTLPNEPEARVNQQMCDQCFSIIKWYSDANPEEPYNGWDYNLIADHLRRTCPKLVADGWSVKEFCDQVQGKERAFGKAVRNYGWDAKKVCTVVEACSYFPPALLRQEIPEVTPQV
ncbi:hypothetical protein Ddc_00175 [Ditylenchus destructor]|nr:hypothetical protein Ddc_00175 [Ditylenchus destructor]